MSSNQAKNFLDFARKHHFSFRINFN